MLIELFKLLLYMYVQIDKDFQCMYNEGVVKCELHSSEELLFNLWRDVHGFVSSYM